MNPFDPYAHLGLPRDASRAEIRAAFRAAAKRLHPDRNPDDPHAEESFKQVVRARDLALGRVRPRRPAPPPPRPRFRYECPGCDDTFEHADDCPRCGHALHDSRKPGRPRPPQDPRIALLIEELERRGPVVESPPSPHWLTALACAFALCAWAVGQIGLFPLTGMLLLYATLIVALDMHERFVPALPAIAR